MKTLRMCTQTHTLKSSFLSTSLQYQSKLFAHSSHRSLDETVFKVHFTDISYSLFFYCFTMKMNPDVSSVSTYIKFTLCALVTSLFPVTSSIPEGYTGQ